MTLTTRCPNCGTAFRVQPLQLSARGGKVRCGKCANVFDGVKGLVAEGVAQGGAAPDNEPSPQLGLFEAANKLPPLPGAGEAANEDAQVAEFLDDAPPPGRRIAWTLAALVALAALLAQAVHQYRSEIAVLLPELRPYLSTVCAALGCELHLPRNIKLLSIESSELRAHPSGEGIVELSASFQNRSPIGQDYPSLLLTLTSKDDEILARRAISPSEYLQGDSSIAIRNGIPPNSITEIKVYFDNRKLEAFGYRISLAYL